ncbi:hypothetical protein DM01DRAFT_254666 [Hesseltinella vesiculosa]|uniref:Uncharacterized protein n=1 Tax=Hesseltinella vesiculosa TaxID=101127 RepID=A0A1X2GIE0_9FUNG|nr:hypothetical protein DM01DRAFT_254666 [Hesseltinella vesiculosa]
MTNISRNFALCIFFNMEYSDENAERLAQQLDSYHELDICYSTEQGKPMLRTKVKTNGDPL